MEVYPVSSALDKYLGGGVVKDGILLIAYDQFSNGWELGMRIFDKILQQGVKGIFFNVSTPLRRSLYRMKFAEVDLEKYMRKSRLAVLDLYASKYNLPELNEHVYIIRPCSPESFPMKFREVKRKIAQNLKVENIKEKGEVGLVETLDSFYHEFGEDHAKWLVNGLLAASERGKLNVLGIFLLDMNNVPGEFFNYVYHIADQVIIIESELIKVMSKFKRRVFFAKSLLKGFEPKMVPYEEIKII
ncbi:hypothetical protein [Thermococcus paralvinellae]|uniref:KaiC-like domain-containing protein n=1 Tax=Thermococcus paralvinellae TaxID=582419 RepID=W0I941_9EURY|nr:hypothetical protein [Thermococcus paralvinellae]AHF81277.1 Hypothetical protein TES1_1902 [Thermococcus paralvinellae]